MPRDIDGFRLTRSGETGHGNVIAERTPTPPTSRPRSDDSRLRVEQSRSTTNGRPLSVVRRSLTVDHHVILGSSPAIVAVHEAIDRLGPTDFTILISGESGTGKELVARELHQRSHRSHCPFIAVNCAALVDSLLEAELFGIEDRTATGVQGRPGKFELADGGTIFLDEVADLSRRAQAALLRVVQDLTVERVGGHRSRRIDTRLIVATNQSLTRCVERRRFRGDLFYRLSGIDICLPPLRERPSDVPLLVEYFLELHGGRGRTLAPEAMDALLRHRWPGNVRELDRVVQRCLAWSSQQEIDADALPSHIRESQHEPDTTYVANPIDTSLRVWTALHVQTVFQECGCNKRRACRRLGINYRTLQSYLNMAASRTRAA